ncbi:hypothetical protein ES703_03219 [subsurface metagenome]
MARISGISRNLPEARISAYECEVNMSGRPVKRKEHKYVKGWYGHFNEKRLLGELIPKLQEYLPGGYSYPFLITTHRLEAKTTADISPPPGRKRARASDIRFQRRRRSSPQEWVAVVLSATTYKLLQSG